MHFTRVGPAEIGRAPERADVIILHQRGGRAEQVAHGPGPAAPKTLTEPRPNVMYMELDRHDLPTLTELMGGQTPGRTSPHQITYFHNSPGNGIQFAAVGARVYQLALSSGAGTRIPTDWFLQDIRD